MKTSFLLGGLVFMLTLVAPSSADIRFGRGTAVSQSPVQPTPGPELASDQSMPADAPAPEAPAPEGCRQGCTPMFGRCGSARTATTACCDEGAVCVAKNSYYAQCLSPSRADANVVDHGWDGTELECGLPGIPDLWPQKEADPVCEEMDIVSCAPDYGKCGGYHMNMTLPCCHEGFECISKNAAFAQCIPMSRAEQNVRTSAWDGRIVRCDGSLQSWEAASASPTGT